MLTALAVEAFALPTQERDRSERGVLDKPDPELSQRTMLLAALRQKQIVSCARSEWGTPKSLGHAQILI